MIIAKCDKKKNNPIDIKLLNRLMLDAAELWRHIKTVLLKLCSCLSTQYRQSFACVIGFILYKTSAFSKNGRYWV